MTTSPEKLVKRMFSDSIATYVSGLISVLLWLVFLSNLCIIITYFPQNLDWQWNNFIRINGFTLLLSTTISFLGAIICTYAKSYFKDPEQKSRFMIHCLGFIMAVLFFIISNHVILLVIGWFLMGLLISKLIGMDTNWGEARESKRVAVQYFVAGSFLLTIGLLLLAYFNNSLFISDLMLNIDEIPQFIKVTSSLCIITAALVQSAIFPFHKWLLSSMTAPTPASALMHAGFVNGSGILLTIVAPLIIASNTLDILLLLGGLSAILAQFIKLIQVNVKQRLACSTIAQMGFMIMQCGLGFFNAAITHLILHSFYKASLFLSNGNEIEQLNPKTPPQIHIKWYQGIIVIIFSLLGAYSFAQLTYKGLKWDSGILLTLIASITVGQITYNIVKQSTFNVWQKIIFPPVLFMSGIVIYALFYNLTTLTLKGFNVIEVSKSISTLQIGFGLIFLIGFFLMKLGIYRKLPWLYVKLLNISLPHKKSILMYKNKIQ
ncbi:proton-conducting transporter membrane subunit [Arenibacter sp. GZD96]|uniref:proton-conducting transporter transmembrane domain-containing protein n=1 Tax=Aurantibrevibacter litoralis TaxID=3106030 RepID=UPI002AFF7872|nr:proton-conducting transporter membrane subunit [Arenibacter sp. GZD-96]MEA1784920.1 proton-conducting transporter membrane subunit [Arenibacter sp. GZD-96]